MGARATVTVLFCDVVGSTALLARLGDAANDELRRDLFGALRRAVEVHGGEEVKSQGDGLMVAFRTSASDAVACAVAMHRAIARLAARDPLLDLAIRVGVATGEATHEEDDWFGTPVVQAARLCAAARPRQVLVTDVLAEVVADGAAFRPVGALSLKGFPEPVPASEVPWEAEDVPAVVPLPPALDTSGELPLAGRDRELGELVAVLDRVISGAGGATLLVSGGAGAGTTRLLAELGAEAQRRGAVVLYGTSIGEALRWYVTAVAPPLLRRQLGEGGALLTSLVPALRVRLPELGEPPAPDHEDLAAAAIAFVARAAAAGPILLMVDDLHAADPRTLALLVDLASSELGPVLLAGGFRHDDGEPLRGGLATVVEKLAALPATTTVDVGPLSEDAVARLAGAGPAGHVFAQSGGNARTVAALVRALAGGATVAEAAARVAPYKGLAPLDVADADVFFGRDELVNEVLGRLGASRMVAIVGASGSGKSSLVRAGVLPALARGALTGSAAWTSVVLRPGPDPGVALEGALAAGPDVVVVDQLEEIFTLCHDLGERGRFVERLVGLAVERGGRTHLVVTLRADFYGHCAAFPALADVLEAGHVLLGPMVEDDLRAAVEGPAAVAGLRLESGLVDLVVADVAGEPGGLPLLSQALLETWRRRRGRTLTVADYREAGGARGAIARTADAVFTTRFDGRQQTLARSVLLRLTEPGQGAEDTRRRLPISDLVPGGELAVEVAGVIEVLTEARLLTVDEGRVEVAHEALIREWPRFRAWIEEDRDALHAHRHLEQAAREWEASGREPGELYRGARLETIMELVSSGRVEPTALERAFVDAAGAERDRVRVDTARRVRRLRLLLAGTAIALVVALAAGGLALEQRGRADRQRDRAEQLAIEADARRLVLEAGALGADQSDLAALLAVEAHRLDAGIETVGGLEAALLREHRLVEVVDDEPGPYRVAASADGSALLRSTFSAGTVVEDGEEMVSLELAGGPVALSGDGATVAATNGAAVTVADVPGPGQVTLTTDLQAYSLALSPTGDRVAIAGVDGRIEVRDAVDGRVVTAMQHGRGGAQLAFGPDGATLASFGADGRESLAVISEEGVGAPPADGTVRLWDATTGAPLAGPVPGPAGAPASVVFSADGRLLAVGSSVFDEPADPIRDEAVVVLDARSLEPGPVTVRGAVAAFDLDGRLAVGDRRGTVVVVDPRTGRRLAPALTVEGLTTLAFRRDGALVAGGTAATVWRWDLGVNLDGPPMGEARSRPVAVSADGSLVAVVTDRNRPDRVSVDGLTTTVHDGVTGEVRGGPFRGVALGIGRGRLVLDRTGAGIVVVDPITGEEVAEVGESALGVSVGASSGDGRRVAVATASGVAVVDVAGPGPAGAVELDLPSGEPVVDIALDRTGERLLVATDGGSVLGGPVGGALGRLDVDARASAVAFTAGGDPLVGTDAGSILLGPDGDPFSSHAGPVVDLAAGERLVASVTQEGRVRLHDLGTGEWVGEPLVTGEAAGVVFRPDGALLTRSPAGVVAWDLDPAGWPALACRAAGRTMAEDEWRQYLPGRPFQPACARPADRLTGDPG